MSQRGTAVILVVKAWIVAGAGHGHDLHHQREAQNGIPRWRLRRDRRRFRRRRPSQTHLEGHIETTGNMHLVLKVYLPPSLCVRCTELILYTES